MTEITEKALAKLIDLVQECSDDLFRLSEHYRGFCLACGDEYQHCEMSCEACGCDSVMSMSNTLALFGDEIC